MSIAAAPMIPISQEMREIPSTSLLQSIISDAEGLSAPSPVPVPHRTRLDHQKISSDYDTLLTKVKWLALTTICLHSLCWFLGLCALTWASAVILGGYVHDLNASHYFYVSGLVLVEAFRLSFAVFFRNLAGRKEAYPKDNSKRRKELIDIGRFASLILQLVIVVNSVFVCIGGIKKLSPSTAGIRGLRRSLLIFYILVLLNGASALVAVWHTTVLVHRCVGTYSLRKYYERIVWRGVDLGLLHATDFDFLRFALKAQSNEYAGKNGARVVQELYKDLIDYMYFHRKGFECACIALDSDDSYEQEAAANIVGLWAKIDQSSKLLRLEKRLLSKLAGAVDYAGETGRAATWSMEQLAKADPQGMVKIKSESGEEIVEILMRRIHEAVEAEVYDMSSVYVKALIPLMESSWWRAEDGKEGQLRNDLRTVFGKEESRLGSRAVAGYALSILNPRDQLPSEEEKQRLRDWNPAVQKSIFILEDEKEYLLRLLGWTEFPQQYPYAKVDVLLNTPAEIANAIAEAEWLSEKSYRRWTVWLIAVAGIVNCIPSLCLRRYIDVGASGGVVGIIVCSGFATVCILEKKNPYHASSVEVQTFAGRSSYYLQAFVAIWLSFGFFAGYALTFWPGFYLMS